MTWYQNLLVGVLFFSALALVGYFTIVSESGPFASRGNQVVVFFDNADGIKTGAGVTVLGVPAGTIDQVDLVPVDEKNKVVDEDSGARVGQRVAVTIELKKNIFFYENYLIEIKNESLLSGKVIAINPGNSVPDKKGYVAQKIGILKTPVAKLSKAGITALELAIESSKTGDGKFQDLQGESSGDPVAGFSEMISENRRNVRETIENIRSITGKINHGKGTLGLLVNDDELHQNANTLVTDAQTVVTELRESLEDTREQAPVTSFVRAALTAF